MGPTICMGERKAVRTAVSAGVLALAAVVLTPVAADATKEPTPAPSVSASVDDPLSGLSVETVAYGSHQRQSMDVWWTPDGQQRPGVFLIHGGWWSGGDKKYMKEITRSYADL